MFFKFLVLILVCYKTKGCLYETFHNTSVTMVGIRRPVGTIDGCFGPQQNLERVSLIQIVNETVPILYEDAFNNLEFLLDIVLENDGIKEVRSGAFKHLPKLYSIRLKHNEIKEIRQGVFNNLSISELNLIDNKIERIESRALDDLPNLNIIILSDNKLTKWDENWFKGSPRLSTLDFENNLITRLPTKAFQNVHGVHLVNNLNISTNIHLNNNKIRLIDDEAFEGLDSLGWLFLQRNELIMFNAKSLGSLRQMDWIRLEHNNLDCIPENLIAVAPNVKYYLDGNPLSEECIQKFDIKAKNNGFSINNLKITRN